MKRHKNRNVHPGEILKDDILVPARLTVTAAAKSLQISRQTLSRVVNQNGSITPDLAESISKTFGGKAEFWLRMQKGYDLQKAESK